MEENTPAVECLILFYINTKHILKTKQLDERVFLDQMTRHCKENGFYMYNHEEIRNTWKDLVSKYLELKANGTLEDKEGWKYYEILDSCYEQADFHNGVYPKFSEEMVWFLIECFLKRKGLEKTVKRNSMLNDIHKEFLQSGYLYITKQDIENKWKYLNLKYDKVKDDPEALNKLPYLQAITGFREKRDKCLVKMIFTKDLTEILIERFTEKRITCVIHGYDSEQVLGEIHYEFRELGFDFSQQEIKEKWRKLTNIYWFLKAKGKHDSCWIYFNAMQNHFKDNFLLEFHKRERKNIYRKINDRRPSLRQRSKSVGADVRTKHNIDVIKTNLVVNIEQLNETQLPPSPKRKPVVEKIPSKRKLSKKLLEEEIEETARDISVKKIRTRSKSREKSKAKEDLALEYGKSKKPIDTTGKNKICESANQMEDGISVRKSAQLSRLYVDRNGIQERKSSTDLGSPGSKVHIINIDHSDIDKKSGNLTINLPSITKQFSDNEFLPLKKRLRLGEGHIDKHPDETRETEDDFLGFPASDTNDDGKRLKSETECKRLTEEEMAEILKSINEDKPEKCSMPDNVNQDPTYCKPEELNYNYMGPYNSFNQPCLIIPKEEQQDNLSLQTYNNPNALTPPPVLLLVIKVDGANNPLREGTTSDVKKDEKNENGKNEAVEKTKPEKSNNVLNISPTINDHSTEGIKPDNPTSNSKSTNYPKVRNTNEVPESSEQVVYQIDNHCINLDKNIQHISNVANEIIITECTKYENKEVDNVQTSNKTSPKENGLKLNKNMVIHDKEVNEPSKTHEVLDTEKVISHNNMVPVVDNTEIPRLVETVPTSAVDKNSTIPQQQPNPKSIRLPVKGGGKVKEIYISPQELNKIARMRPQDFKIKPNLVKAANNEVTKTATEPNISPTKKIPNFKFVSHTIKPPFIQKPVENKPEKNIHKAKSKANSTVEHKDDIPAPPVFISPSKFVGTNNSSVGNRTLKNEEFESESVFSEAVGDDEGLKDNLLATVVDFQEQNNQEFVEIKNLMKQNNLLQRETNRLLRLMLEKM